MAAANAGDASAFDALYLRYRDWVLRVAYRYTHNRDDALDVLQETFLYLLGKFPGLRLTSRLTTFLYPAVRNIALTHRRKRDRQAGAGAADPATAAPPGPADNDLPTLLAGLTDAQREVILMRFVDDMTPTEIATALETPVGTIKSRLHGAIERLREDPRTQRYFAE
ncbi:MAG: sigma-70 family RNA polymerase sigma factor [Phycisphaerae bacterium]